jgi:PAS domain S-box-containing protein
MPNKKIILFVEGGGRVASTLKRTLERLGYQVIIAGSGEEAIRETRTTAGIDLILMDVNPKQGLMDGAQTAEAILSEKDIPILFLCGDAGLEILEKTGKIASYGCIARKCSETLLSVSLAAALRLHAALSTIRESERSLRRMKEHLELVQNAAGVGMWHWEVSSGVMRWTSRMFRLLGLDERAVHASFEVWRKAIHPEDRKNVELRIKGALERHTPLSCEYRVVRPDGRVRWVAALGREVHDDYGRPLGLAGTCVDVTERKEAEEALCRSEERLNFILRESHTGGWDMDLVNQVACRTEEHDRIFGYDPPVPEWTYQTFLDHVIPEDRPEVDRLFREATRLQGDWNFECRIRRKDGEVRWIWASGEHHRDRKGRMRYIRGIIQDITERKRVEEELRGRSEAMALSVDGMAILNRDGEYVYVNEAHARIYGYAGSDELVGKTWKILYDNGELRRFETEIMPRFWEDGTWRGEAVGRKKDGSRFPQDVSLTDLGDGRFICVVRDMTELRRLVSQLQHARKMEAIGTLAGGVAHDFNNIVTVVMGFTELLHMKVDRSSELRLYADQILSACQKAAYLTKSLLAFSRQQPVTLVPIDINSAIRSVKKLLKKLLTENIDLHTFLTERDAVVMADRSQVDQILFNLAKNAGDAMGKGGKLTIGTDIVMIDSDFIEANGFGKPGRYVMISVSDTGEGMDEITKTKIFDPFFTTKEAGKGTGLGLAMVYGTVKQHNGYITVDSEPGHGTTFRIYIPAVNMKVHHEKVETPRAPGGCETILVAEDDEQVRKVIREALGHHGYKTIEATDGQDAVDKFKRHRDVDLVILDFVMPRKNGRQAYEEMRGMKPGIKALFTSGYAKDIVRNNEIIEGILNFLPKPVSLEKLLQKVREILDKK